MTLTTAPPGRRRARGRAQHVRRGRRCSTKKSSSVSRIGLSETRCAPAGGQLGEQLLGRRVERQLERVAPLADPHGARARAGRATAISASLDAGDDQLPAARAEREHVGQPARRSTSRPFARIATRLQSASASLSTCELKKTVQPAIAQPQDERAHVAAAERIEARHRLVEDDELRDR